MRTHRRDRRYVSIFNTISSGMLQLKTGYLKKRCTKSGIKSHFRSSKYDTNPPSQKLQDKTVQNFQIFKLQNRGGNGHFKVDKYEEIEKSLWRIIFRSVTKHFPKIFFNHLSLCSNFQNLGSKYSENTRGHHFSTK